MYTKVITTAAKGPFLDEHDTKRNFLRESAASMSSYNIIVVCCSHHASIHDSSAYQWKHSHSFLLVCTDSS